MINHPENSIVKVAIYNLAVYQFAVSALRNIIGQHTLDEVLREREKNQCNPAEISRSDNRALGC